ncbi:MULTISPECIES: ShlB/FhaC/HecB family hemolysin secretion/activation protein [Pectobacterium]|uniref:ShlB/FhaC/HecB family hemolysin secretion/activation protein n=1 Tax=Pectobacterium TaxID=122277 RepID=UPI001F211EB0|nr:MULTISPECIES: ShlB/FhaC/HecB family hemolysin secretion/activation protein [Pectobacterium]
MRLLRVRHPVRPIRPLRRHAHHQRQRTVTLSISTDNSGQKNTGREQLSTHLTFDNPLRLADRWWLTASRDSAFSHSYGSKALSGGMSLPYGYWTLGYQYAWNDFFQPIPIGSSA